MRVVCKHPLPTNEQESLRGLLHMIQDPGALLVPNMAAAVGMRLTNGIVLDEAIGYSKPNSYQLSIAEQCFRFMDSEINYNDTEVAMLLR